MYHLERSLQRENWEVLAAGERVGEGRDVVRVVTGGAARRVVVRDSNAEDADTMKMLVDEEEVPPPQGEGRRVEGGVEGYGDWFSNYAEEGTQATGEEERRTSVDSVYELFQSIYDAYGDVEWVEEGHEGEEDAGMF